jgi:hypothetical protein
MVFAATLLLFATAAFAAPRSNIDARIARRAGAHLSGPRLPADGLEAQVGNVSHVSYSSNWAGASWESPAGTYKSVTGEQIQPPARQFAPC